MTTINIPVDLSKLSLDQLYKALEIAPDAMANTIREEINSRFARIRGARTFNPAAITRVDSSRPIG
jgi:hypothetical protein